MRRTTTQIITEAIESLVPHAAPDFLSVRVAEDTPLSPTSAATRLWAGSPAALAGHIAAALDRQPGTAPAETEDTSAGGEFFAAGRAYTTQTGYLAPELAMSFACAAVTRTPDGERIAFGFFRSGTPVWVPTGLGYNDFTSHAWSPERPPEWLAATAAALSPFARAEQAKRGRDIAGEIGILTRAHDELTSAPWYPARPGDVVHVHLEAGGEMPAYGETYVVSDGSGGLMMMQLLAHTLPESADPDASGVGAFAVDAADCPLYEAWFEAGPHRLTIVRDGRPVHIGGAL